MVHFRRCAAVTVVLCSAGCGGADQGPEPAGRIEHNDPRPECRYTVDSNRVPWRMPQVVGTGWGTPIKLATLNTACPEDAIEISRDGSTLYFYWSPTVGAASDELLNGTTGTYYAARVGSEPGSFANPRFLDLRQDAPGGACDGELSFTPAGDQVYFHSNRADNTGYRQQPPMADFLDIYVAAVTGGRPGAAQNLGPAVNSIYPDGEHCLSPDGSKLYLTSQRPGGVGATDIWVSTRAGSAWSAPVNLGAPLNSTGADLQPALAANDPGTMYFVSDRGGAAAIYRSTFQGASWSQPAPVITGYVGEPSLVADGSVLYFVHVLVDGAGVFGSDIWYVRRTN